MIRGPIFYGFLGQCLILLGVISLSVLGSCSANFNSVRVLFWDCVGFLWGCCGIVLWTVSVLLRSRFGDSIGLFLRIVIGLFWNCFEIVLDCVGIVWGLFCFFYLCPLHLHVRPLMDTLLMCSKVFTKERASRSHAKTGIGPDGRLSDEGKRLDT